MMMMMWVSNLSSKDKGSLKIRQKMKYPRHTAALFSIGD